MTFPMLPDGSLPPGAHLIAPDVLRAAFTDSGPRLVVDAALVTATRMRSCFDVRRVLLGGNLVDPLTDRSTGRMLICLADHHEIETGMIGSDNAPLTILTTLDALVTFPYLPDDPVDVHMSTLLPVGGVLDTGLYLDHQLSRSQSYMYWLGNDGGYLEVTS